MNTHNMIELPPLPYPQIPGNDYTASDMQAYATAAIEADRERKGEVVVTKTLDGEIVAVTRQDEEGRILSVIAEAGSERGGEPVAWVILEEEIKMIREKDMSHFKHVGYQYKENGTWYPATLLQHTIEGNGWEIRKIYAEVNE